MSELNGIVVTLVDILGEMIQWKPFGLQIPWVKDSDSTFDSCMTCTGIEMLRALHGIVATLV